MSLLIKLDYNMKEDIRKILESAILAPSGENCQPWKFIVNETAIKLYNVPEKDMSIYNFKQSGSFLANGAVIENIMIAASALGYNADVNLFPDKGNENFVAEIKFSKTSPQKEELYQYIPLRVTNRKPYKDIPLTLQQMEEIRAVASELNYGKVYLIEDKASREILGQAVSSNEKVMLNNKYLHQFFFDHISWNKKEDDEKKEGFFIDTLELPPPIKAIFRAFKNWSFMSLLNKLGFYKMIAKQNANAYSSAPVMGILIAEGNTSKDYVMTGRVVQRIWLKITKQGLYLHPLAGQLYIWLTITAGETEHFSNEQIETIKTAYSNIEKVFDVKGKNIAFMFRIGQADAPTAKSSRFTVDEVTEVTN